MPRRPRAAIADRHPSAAVVRIRRTRITGTPAIRRCASGAGRRVTAAAVRIRRTRTIAMVPVRTSAPGAVRPARVADARTARRIITNAERGEHAE